MPGHKRRLYTVFPEIVENPYLIDVTEVGKLDNLHHPQGVIRSAMEQTAQVYGAESSYFLVGGSTCGILAAISAVCRPGDSLILARNCHKSVYHAVRLLGLRAHYIMPEWNEKWDLFGSLDPDSVRKVIKRHPDAKAVVIVSPTYEGVVSDVEKIAKIAHKAKLPLIVDAAHGAHFEYMKHVNETISNVDYDRIPESAIRLGADIVVESLHKTLPALTQCSLLHFNSKLVKRERVEEFLQIYQTSSPSYVMMASMEACIVKMDHERDGLFIIYKELLAEYRKQFGRLSHIHLVGPEDFGRSELYGYDEGKLVFSVVGCGIRQEGETVPLTGTMLADILHREYGQVMEMAGSSYVVAMTSVADSKEAFEALLGAMETIDGQVTDWDQPADTTLYRILPERQMPIAEALSKGQETVAFMDAAGRVSAAFLYAYPPGIPIVVPGEILSAEILKELKKAGESGLVIMGIEEDARIRVVADKMDWFKKKTRVRRKWGRAGDPDESK